MAAATVNTNTSAGSLVDSKKSRIPDCKLPVAEAKSLTKSIPFEYSSGLRDTVPTTLGFNRDDITRVFELLTKTRRVITARPYAVVSPDWSKQPADLGFSFSDVKELSESHVLVAIVLPSGDKRPHQKASRDALLLAANMSAKDAGWEEIKPHQALSGSAKLDAVWYKRTGTVPKD